MENKYKLLLAEDDTALRDIAALFFRKNGFDVDTAINGDEACALVDKNRYDTIILDIMMPGKDGKEVCSYIRKKDDVPVNLEEVAQIGRSYVDQREQCFLLREIWAFACKQIACFLTQGAFPKRLVHYYDYFSGLAADTWEHRSVALASEKAECHA